MAANCVNNAAWQHEKTGPITVGAADLWQPEPGEVRIKVHAASIQPADAKIAHQAMLSLTYPAILGVSCAGTVDALGEGVTKVKLGDRVTAGLDNYANRGDPARGALQQFTLAKAAEVVDIGPDLAFANAVAANTQTPAAALFKFLGMQYPSSDVQPKDETILIWGGSGAIGLLSVRYAKMAGYKVLATASKKNFDMVRDAGADEVLDRNDPDVLEQLKTHLPITFWYDTIALPGTIAVLFKLAEVQRNQSGGKDNINIVTLLPVTSTGYATAPEGVTTQFMMFRGKLEENKAHFDWLMSQGGFLETGLKDGTIKGVPAEVVGGLDAVQAATERVLAGVSGVKVVIDPWRE